MAKIRTTTDIRNKLSEISDYSKETKDNIFINENEIVYMDVTSDETYERKEIPLELYSKLVESEIEILNGDEGVDFSLYADKMRNNVLGR